MAAPRMAAGDETGIKANDCWSDRALMCYKIWFHVDYQIKENALKGKECPLDNW